MKRLLIFGCGKSASKMINYLCKYTTEDNYHITLCDQEFTDNIAAYASESVDLVRLSILNDMKRRALIQAHDLVISMLPVRFHLIIAKDCLRYSKHLFTASYVSKEMQRMSRAVEEKGIFFLNEMGVDPGIDHMSALKIMDEIKAQGGNIILFESFTGGLIAPENDTNLWNYKFTWNPRNVVLAGQGGAAKFIQEGQYKYIPYQKLFRRTEFFDLGEHGRFEAYANRDSLSYREAYQLQDIPTLFRGTLRRVGFSRAWQVFVTLGLTDDSYAMENTEGMSYRAYINSFLPYHPNDSVELKLRSYLNIEQDDILWDKLLELELFSSQKKIPLKNASPAQILQYILEHAWKLEPEDRDMIVMVHRIGYTLNGDRKQIDAHMVVKGDDAIHTAMAKTVGLPLAIATRLFIKGIIAEKGVCIPNRPEIYLPILAELKKYDIAFEEKEVAYQGYNSYIT